MANRKTKYKTITHIPGQIRVTLPNGTRKTFQNSTDALTFFDLNFGDGYSMEITSTTDNNGEVTINGGELPEVTVVGKAPDKPKEPEPIDPIREAIFEGRYNSRKFTPTPANILHFLDLYESDKRIAEGYGNKAWGKVLGTHLAAAGGIYAGLTAPAWLPWAWKTGAPLFAKHIAAPTAAGMIWDEGLRALTGTTTTEQISNWLQKEKGWNPTMADMAGGLSNPGYWINFGGTGLYTRPLFNKIGLGLANPAAPIELSPTILAHMNAMMPKSKLLTKVVDPALAWTDRNLYRLQLYASPWLAARERASISTSDLPTFRFAKDPSELQTLTDRMKYEYPETRGQVLDYLLFKSNTNNEKVFGDAMRLTTPKFDIQFHNDWKNPAPLLVTSLTAGASAADMAFGSDDRHPAIRALEYFALGRYGIDALARHRVSSTMGKADNYFHNFQDIRGRINNTLDRLSRKYGSYTPRGVEGRGYTQTFDSKGSVFFPEDYQFQTTKPGFNYKGATFDDLIKFLDKNKIINRNLREFNSDANTLYDSTGRVIAKRSSNGRIDLVNEQELRNILAKDIDIVDYTTGNRFRGKILVGDDGTVNMPEEYTRTLRSNIDYVLNTLFPGSGVKVFGSSAGVTEAGFPHATHDVDFYITLSEIDKLLANGMLKESDRINPGTYTYRLKPSEFGEQGNIDLNVLELTPEGMATGIRAEELFRQYFPDDYFKALRDFKSRQSNGDPDLAFHIGKTPEELLGAMDPSSKTIMDSFDIDYTAPAKGKHALRAWAHLVYSDPALVSQGLNLYAQSMLGSRVKLFPMSADQLTDKELNMQALQKLGVGLRDFEMLRIASDPLRMKNVLDAWYMMDNTAMRYIRGTWPGTDGYSPENFVKSATIWDPVNNGGNAHGAGLNTTIGGDSLWMGDLKAFISPNTQYKSTNLLDMIDEVNSNFGRNPEARQLLRDASHGLPEEQVSKLLSVYDTKGWNFLQDGADYGQGKYASATRPFDINSDYVGFSPLRTKLNPLIPRIKVSDKENPLSRTGWMAPFTGRRDIPTFWDYNKGQRPFLLEFFMSNRNRIVNLRSPSHTNQGNLLKSDFMNPSVESIAVGTPAGITGTVVGINSWMDSRRRDRIEGYKTLSDEVILSMSEKDRSMYTPEGVDSLYQYYRTNPIWDGATQNELDRAVDYDLRTTYDRYQNKKETGN